ncbi:hypothetical protein DSL72_007431 [Monilinia vaccinii-corymbosi]|uniref:Alpha/beta hydrolase fold-3 domain-containing protein n=1 Tax=Monilinia vaccinii-corymbosi TaxID=61207 RepID=A0A8A3PMY9_9HELO|nr:hypothetical protein DSL72_007431 [Monilinia vaccinii-corymbosi]
MRVYVHGHSTRTLGVLTRVTTKKWPSVQKPRQLATAASWPVERYDITCGISGQITVELHNSFLLRNSPETPLVIYLPPYPTSPLPPLQPPSWLLNSYPVFNIPYRWYNNPKISFRKEKFHPFPIPIHDTLQAYSWLLDRYLPSLSPEPKPLDSPNRDNPPNPIQRPLLIYGSYLGGTLATSLALTESFVSSPLPTKIHSLIVHNGIFDWTPISTTLDPSTFPTDSSYPSSPNLSLTSMSTTELYARYPWTTLTLHALKTRLFSSPSQTFDPFASPILFFRTAGINIPKRWPLPPPPSEPETNFIDAYDFPSSPLDDPYDISPYPSSPLDDPWDTPVTPPEEQGQEPEAHKESRKRTRMFPPPNSPLEIPRSLFTYTSPQDKYARRVQHDDEHENDNADIFHHQARELTQLMRRSITEHGLREGDLWDEDYDAVGLAGERVRYVEVGGGGGGARGDGSECGDGAEREEIVQGWIEEGGL